MRVFRRPTRPPFKRPLPADPPADARLFDVDGVPVARVEGELAVAYDPEPRPYSGSMMFALSVPRETFDAGCAWHREYRAMKAIGGVDFELWLMINNELAARETRAAVRRWLAETEGRWG